MEKQRILEAVEINNDLLMPGVVYIKHPKNPDTVYLPVRKVLMHTETGEWVEAVLYRENESGTHYCRRADDFAKFSEVER